MNAGEIASFGGSWLRVDGLIKLDVMLFLAYQTRLSPIFISANKMVFGCIWSCNSVVKTLGVDVIATSQATSTFNSADVSEYKRCTLMAMPTLKSNAGDQKVCKKKNLPWFFGADREICPSGSLFGITRQSLVMPDRSLAWSFDPPVFQIKRWDLQTEVSQVTSSWPFSCWWDIKKPQLSLTQPAQLYKAAC